MFTELTTYNASINGSSELDVMALGKVLSQSGYFQDAKEAAQAAVKVLAGRELGIGAIAAMTGIFIVKGRVTLSANLIAAIIMRSLKYRYRVTRLDDTGCEIAFYEGNQEIGRSVFNEGDAKAAGLAGGDNWRKFPRNMYFARAMSNGAKWYCPDVFAGPVYTPDELDDVPSLPPAPLADVLTGEVVEAPAQPAPKPNGNTKALYISKINALIACARAIGIEITDADGLESKTLDELKNAGQKLRNAIAEHIGLLRDECVRLVGAPLPEEELMIDPFKADPAVIQQHGEMLNARIVALQTSAPAEEVTA